MRRWLVPGITALLAASSSAGATLGDNAEYAAPSAQRCLFEGECGWWWGFIEELREDEEEPEAPPTTEATPQPPIEEEEPSCTDPDEWTAERCGFVDPAGDFRFQEIQRDALFERAVMNPRDHVAVRDLQHYIAWMVDQALMLAAVWEYNLVQDPSLDPSVNNPVSRFGIRANARLKKDRRQNVFEEVRRQGGMLVWWTREDCPYCHDMARPMEVVARRSGIDVHNLAVQGECIPGFSPENCVAGDLAREPARALGVEVVPTVMLFLPADDAWVRVATGIEDADTILSRIESYFGAIMGAAAQGLDAAASARPLPGSPSVDFTPSAVERALGGGGTVPIEDKE